VAMMISIFWDIMPNFILIETGLVKSLLHELEVNF
jgi:hypothetical protein